MFNSKDIFDSCSNFRMDKCSRMTSLLPKKWWWVKRKWNQYKQRFVPWIAMSLKNTNHPKLVISPGTIISSRETSLPVNHVRKADDHLCTDVQLTELLTKFLPRLTYYNYQKYSSQMEACVKNKGAMRDYFGFSVTTRPSQISGTGVFVDYGTVKTGTVVGLYPGTIYMKHESILFQSITNHYILRCSDTLLVDGNHRGISKSIFRSCALRDQFSHDIPACDITWLTPHPVNPLAVGQFVNNHVKVGENNVVYQECYLPFPSARNSTDSNELSVSNWKYLPNLWSNPENNSLGLKVIPLIAVRDIEEGEELLSAYLTLIH